jgi:hypothetical protein
MPGVHEAASRWQSARQEFVHPPHGIPGTICDVNQQPAYDELNHDAHNCDFFYVLFDWEENLGTGRARGGSPIAEILSPELSHHSQHSRHRK